MRSLLAYERRGPAAASIVLLGTIALTCVMVAEERGLHRVLPFVACIAAMTAWIGSRTERGYGERIVEWRNLLAGLVVVILFIPMNRYSLPVRLPFQLEPYRIVVAALALGWIVSMLVDRRVRLHRSGFDAPLLFILLVTFLSDIANPGRAQSLSSYVLKGQTFFLSFFVVLYLVASVVRTRESLLVLVRLLAGAGGIVAAFAIVERRTGYNIFNHLHSFFPLLRYVGTGEQVRDGHARAMASSEHPIALSVLLVLLLPLVVYLCRYGSRNWLIVAALYVIGIFSTASRTGIIGLLVMVIVYLCLQPRTLLRAWPLAVPLLAAVHVAAPGALGSFRETLNPSFAVKEQDTITVGNDAYGSGRLTDLGPSLSQWSAKPLLGIGAFTRVPVGPDANARILDDQWLGTLLEVGYFGFLAWLWLFVRSIRRLSRTASEEGDSEDGWLFTGFAASITAFAVTMLFYDTFTFEQNVFVCFILIGLSGAFLSIRAREAAALPDFGRTRLGAQRPVVEA